MGQAGPAAVAVGSVRSETVPQERVLIAADLPGIDDGLWSHGIAPTPAPPGAAERARGGGPWERRARGGPRAGAGAAPRPRPGPAPSLRGGGRAAARPRGPRRAGAGWGKGGLPP